MHAAASRRISNAVDTRSLVRALAVTITPIALHATIGDPHWLLVALVTIPRGESCRAATPASGQSAPLKIRLTRPEAESQRPTSVA